MGRKRTEPERLLGAHCSIAGGVAGAPLIGAQIGATAIQLFTGSNQQWRTRPISDEEAGRFRRNMAEGGIRVAFAHAMYLINLAAPDPEVFRKSVRAMAEELKRADILGLPFVVIHPGAPKERGARWGIARAAEAVDRACELAGDVRARIALETTAGQGSCIGCAFEEIAAIIDQTEQKERLAVCFDTCHAFAAGYDIRSKEGYEETWRQFDRIVGVRRLAAIHLNDSKGGLGSRIDRHTHIGKGRIGLAGFRLLVNDPRFIRIPMVLETPKGDEAVRADRKNLAILRRLIKKE